MVLQARDLDRLKVKLFIIFHKKIYSELYRTLTKYKKNVTFIGTGKRISRIRQMLRGYHIIYEKDLAKYDASMDNKRYHETTAIYHIYVNKLYQGNDYIGFLQYDMIVGDKAIEQIKHYIVGNPAKNYIFYMFKLNTKDKWGYKWLPKEIAEFIIDHYNRTFQTAYDIKDIYDNPEIANNLIMCATFIIPVKMFEKIMGWISQLIYDLRPFSNQLIMHDSSDFGHVFERVYGLALAIESLNKNVELVQAPITHMCKYERPTLRTKIEPYLRKNTTSNQRYIIWKCFSICKLMINPIKLFHRKKKTKIYSIYTDEAVRLKDVFLKSIKDDWEVNIIYWGKIGEGEGDWATPGFVKLIRRRIEYLVDIIKKNEGDIIIWSDMDIQFFGKCTKLIEKAMAGNDIAFLSEHWPGKEINAGFMAIRCGQKTIQFFEAVLNTHFEELKYHDQSAINDILRENSIGIRWDILPRQFWAMSHGGQPPRDIVLHHANCTAPHIRNGKRIGSIELKLEQLEKIRNHVRLSWFFDLKLSIKKLAKGGLYGCF